MKTVEERLEAAREALRRLKAYIDGRLVFNGNIDCEVVRRIISEGLDG